jgi:hypothetical protein
MRTGGTQKEKSSNTKEKRKKGLEKLQTPKKVEKELK